MNPHWQDAPEWAQWLAQDSDGQWFWHQLEVALLFVEGQSGPGCWTNHGGRVKWARKSPVAGDWTQTKEARP